MIEGLKPYPAYKESGLAWVPEIPATWDTARNGNLFQQRNETRRSELPVLEVSLRTGVRIRNFDTSKRKQVMADFGKYKRAAAGDIAYNMMRMWQGAVGVAPVDGLVSPAYVVARPFSNTKSSYYASLFRMGLYMGEIDAVSRGIVKDRNRLYWDQFKQMRSLVPPPDEQSAIVRFLDHANRKIDGFIRAKRKLIGLLNEQKQAIIHRAVTRGLDPNAKLKPSGIPWLGEIPAHWTLSPNRAFLRIRKVLVGERHPHFTLLSLTKRGLIVRDLSEMRGKFSSDMGTSQEVRKGDLVLCLFDVPETPRTVGLSWHRGMITGAYTVMECKDQEIAQYLELFYIAMDDRKLLSPLYSGLRNTIPKERFLGAKTPIPPSHERVAILNSVKAGTASLDLTIARTEREIALMQEYRTRLTADIVTGKLDVREAAAKLPEPEAEEAADSEIPEDETELEEAEE